MAELDTCIFGSSVLTMRSPGTHVVDPESHIRVILIFDWEAVRERFEGYHLKKV